jgi:hypothetical protein
MNVYNIGDLVAVRRPQQREIQNVYSMGCHVPYKVPGPPTEHYQSPYFPGWVFGYVMERDPDGTYAILRIETWGALREQAGERLEHFGAEIRAQEHDMARALWTFFGPAVASCLSNRET